MTGSSWFRLELSILSTLSASSLEYPHMRVSVEPKLPDRWYEAIDAMVSKAGLDGS